MAMPAERAFGERELTAVPSQRSIDQRRERIRVETTRHRIEGYVTLARDGFRSRVSDMLNASERDFLTLTDATVAPLDGSPAETHTFLAVARAHIVFAVVVERDGGEGGGEGGAEEPGDGGPVGV